MSVLRVFGVHSRRDVGVQPLDECNISCRGRVHVPAPECGPKGVRRRNLEPIFATQATESGGPVLGTKEPDWIAALALRRIKFVREQFYLAAVAQNLKRLVRFLNMRAQPAMATA